MWSLSRVQVRNTCPEESDTNTCPKEWLQVMARQFEEFSSDTINIPTQTDGSPYTASRLYQDQKAIVAVVLDKIMEWVTADDLKDFEPLRMTINGPAGTGKTIVINTLVSIIRQLFQDSDVAQVCAPTGAAGFNAGGGTLHHLLCNKAGQPDYEPFSMSDAKREKLAAKFKNLLCLIIDERSLLDTKMLGISEQMISETIHDGELSEESWGKLPVLIIVGDDYQLPSIAEGAFNIHSSRPGSGSKMVQAGRRILEECANCVMSLNTSRRIKKKQTMDKAILQKLRVAEELSDAELTKIMNLHLDEMKKKHGPQVVEEIKSKSIYLYYRNHKRIFKNLELLVKNSSKENPVAICKTISKGSYNGKAIRKHFKRSEVPSSALLTVGCKVAIENRNFCPQWGLHNGAVGTIDEIVFDRGTDPNRGDLPAYVVVDFPHYIGPAWDKNNPTVREKN